MDDALVSWKAEPDFRGTFTILATCFGTLVICLWNIQHPDVGSTPIKWKWLKRGRYILSCLLFPEVMSYLAYAQLREAIRITRDGRMMLNVSDGTIQHRSRLMRFLEWLVALEPRDTSAERPVDIESHISHGNSQIVRQHRWTLTHGFYAAMGGFVLKDPRVGDHYLPMWQGNGVLTCDGVRFLMQNAPSLVPDIAPEDILDHSKADELAKALLIAQVLWFLLNCINRTAQGLPLSLLEIATISNALCSLLTYAMWWRKPKNVRCPTIIVAQDARLIGAWMSMASVTRLPSGSSLWRRVAVHPSEMFHVQLVEPDDGPTPEPRPQLSFRRRPLPRKRPTFGGITASRVVPWYLGMASETEEDKITTALRWALAAKAHQQYGLSLPTSAVLYVSPGPYRDCKDLVGEGFVNAARFCAIFAVAPAIYGIPHFLAFGTAFPSAIERTLWQVATVVVATIAPTGLGMIIGGTVIYAWLLTGSRKITPVDRRHVRWLTACLASFCMLVYLLASGYLVAESVRQLFALPPEAFMLPSWSNYWPHLF